MMKYTITRQGNQVMTVEFIGPRSDNFRDHVIVPVQFDDFESAKEVANIWEDSQVVEVKNNLLSA